MTEDWVQYQISDDGPSIKQDRLNRIFDPFYATENIGEGAGLGLSVSCGIVKKYAGELRAESFFDKGTKFIVRLPVDEEGM